MSKGVTAEYMQILQSRVGYFRDKKIIDLSDKEIREFLVLKKELGNVFPEIEELIEKLWDAIFEGVKPYVDAAEEYAKHVTEGDKH